MSQGEQLFLDFAFAGAAESFVTATRVLEATVAREHTAQGTAAREGALAARDSVPAEMRTRRFADGTKALEAAEDALSAGNLERGLASFTEAKTHFDAAAIESRALLA